MKRTGHSLRYVEAKMFHEHKRKMQPPRYRPSFTLVELLVAIGIIGVMASMVLYSLAGAQVDAKINRTRGTIEKLNAVILERWEEFRYRAVRLDIDPDRLRPNPATGRPLISAREGARLRMFALRDTMRMEMPDRMTDLAYPPAFYVVQQTDGSNYSLPSRAVPGRYNNLRRSMGMGYYPLGGASYSGAVVPQWGGNANAQANSNASAELLYQIVASEQYLGGNAIEAFRPTEIGDTDEDGLPEFIDAWENPIQWLRWPSGYDSVLNDRTVQDAMDPLRTDRRWSDNNYDQKPWLLVPLIVSAGPDGEFDLRIEPDGSDMVYATDLDPYTGWYDASGNPAGQGFGSVFDQNGIDEWSDNITNYNLLLE